MNTAYPDNGGELFLAVFFALPVLCLIGVAMTGVLVRLSRSLHLDESYDQHMNRLQAKRLDALREEMRRKRGAWRDERIPYQDTTDVDDNNYFDVTNSHTWD